MAIINPDGLFSGERIAQCSDEAQLHWTRLFVASNTFGRLELNYDSIVRTVYASFKNKPSEKQLNSWLQEYFDNFLLFIYEAENGSVWGQWLTSTEYLSRYQTAADRRSPAPDASDLEKYRKSYTNSKKSKSFRFNNNSKPYQTTSIRNESSTPPASISREIADEPAELFEEENEKYKSREINIVSEPHQTMLLGIGNGNGIGKEQIPSPKKVGKQTDLRRKEFISDLNDYWDSANPNVKFCFNARDGKQVDVFLSSWPHIQRDDWLQCLRNRRISEGIIFTEEIYRWVTFLMNFKDSPLNRYGKPKDQGELNGKLDRAGNAAARVVANIENRISANRGELLSGRGSE